MQSQIKLTEETAPVFPDSSGPSLPALFAREDGVWRALNVEANGLAHTYDWFRFWNGRINFTDPATDRAFQDRVARSLKADSPSPEGGHRHSLVVRGTDGRPSGMVLVFPDRGVSVFGAIGLARRLVYVVVIPEAQRRKEQARALIEMGDLTSAEGQLVHDLLAGRSVREVARDTDRSIATVRWHIRNIFAKLGVSRIDDLYRIAAMVP